VKSQDRKVYKLVTETQPHCILCGSQNEAQLIMHHVIHGAGTRRTIVDNKINIARVCTLCHIKIHQNDKKFKPILLKKLENIYGKMEMDKRL
jgi:hypothetical protein